MWEEILKTAVGNGLWAVLFCVLLLYQLRDGRARESKYRQTINVLLDRLGTLEEVERGVNEAVTLLRKRERKRGAPVQTASAVQAATDEVLNV